MNSNRKIKNETFLQKQQRIVKEIKANKKKEEDKIIPWWVDVLFIQIGLPDKLLIKILKTKKKTKDLISNIKIKSKTLIHEKTDNPCKTK